MVAKGTNDLTPWNVPKGTDVLVTETAAGGGEQRRHKGIYELAPDTRRICLASPGRDRPTTFSVPPGSGWVLVTFERIADN